MKSADSAVKWDVPHTGYSSSVVRESTEYPSEPEKRMLVRDISWDGYLQLDNILSGTGTRVFYCDGVVEFMSISAEHERIKQMIHDLVVRYCVDRDIEYTSEGSATRTLIESRAAEPDDTFFFGAELGDTPDIVLEVALTSGGIHKQILYSAFDIPEAWIYERGVLKVYRLEDGAYLERERSGFMPGLDIGLVSELATRASKGERASALLKEFIRRQG